MDNQKQQIVDKLKTANNVLVTVSNGPSVDQLSSAIGLALSLTKLGKHAVAVFSGNVPSTIEFLKPEETLEKTTDSLRDFIISLDKAKADKLRYKVEDDVVRIFITPYRSSITDKDLNFSQGDFNVDAVVALGVHEQKDLDEAITAHGRILHDATVITINNTQGADLGAVNLTDTTASSHAELVTDVVVELGQDVLDAQIATALLTGIVAETDRFSNERTTASTMRLSGILMAAGANQQLVATKLEEAVEEQQPVATPAPAPIEPVVAPAPPAAPANEVVIEAVQLKHEEEPAVKEVSAAEEVPAEIHIDDNGTLQVAHSAQTTTATGREFLGSSPAAPSDVLSLPSVPTGTEPILSHDTPVAAPPHDPYAPSHERVIPVPTHVADARDAVAAAVAESPAPLPPITALNAQPLGDQLHSAPPVPNFPVAEQPVTLAVPTQPVPYPAVQPQPPTPESAPPVPPPIMPPMQQ